MTANKYARLECCRYWDIVTRPACGRKSRFGEFCPVSRHDVFRNASCSALSLSNASSYLSCKIAVKHAICRQISEIFVERGKVSSQTLPQWRGKTSNPGASILRPSALALSCFPSARDSNPTESWWSGISFQFGYGYLGGLPVGVCLGLVMHEIQAIAKSHC